MPPAGVEPTIPAMSGVKFGMLLHALTLLLPPSPLNFSHPAHLAHTKMISATWLHTRLLSYYVLVVGWDSSVGKAIVYWLNGPGIESRWEHDFPHPQNAQNLQNAPQYYVIWTLPAFFFFILNFRF